ncbi:MAG: histone deacetylase [bacterium]|nr:histone deacetylase [bacterium]
MAKLKIQRLWTQSILLAGLILLFGFWYFLLSYKIICYNNENIKINGRKNRELRVEEAGTKGFFTPQISPLKSDIMVTFIYSNNYYCDIGEHVFPMEKYRMIYETLMNKKLVPPHAVLEPQPATYDQLQLVHTEPYLNDLLNLRWTYRTMYSELPLTKQIVDAYFLAAGGTILAARKAIETNGIGVNIGGGFHHAFADHAEGFCYINDIAVAIRVMQYENKIKTAFVIDCDLHQGNGTAHIFLHDDTVFTFSIHQENNYPIKQKSDLDIGLDDFANDSVYLAAMQTVIPKQIDAFNPDLIVYVAGADPYEHDQLGKLKLTMDGLRHRDDLVTDYCRKKKIPLVIVLAGGYAVSVKDTVRIHVNTCKSALGIK